ncbi:MAG TPA: isoamylase [Kofleriaceae bacterium]|nr:isoamylase [Kofleriaceae bacterium]
MRGAILIVAAACVHHSGVTGSDAPGSDAGLAWQPALGAHWTPAGDAVVFRVASTRATRIELDVFAAPTGAPAVQTVAMTQEAGATVWRAELPAAVLPATIYYGYRVWGPNWPYDPSWQPGSDAGWQTDCDAAGNRMNPNKLVFDPYAAELSHDPETPTQADGSPYAVGSHRDTDSAPVAPKGIVLRDQPADFGQKPTRALADDIIYEVHVRGFTEADPTAGSCAGTYAGAAGRASYLASLGVTAIELMPIAETENDRNDVDPASDTGDNYWGYSTLAYFAPDRRYACDRSPGGPTAEFRAMVKAFHAQGIKVVLDVVYNHTAEGGGSSLLSLRGLDNAGYYQLDAAGTGYTNDNGVGADVAAQKPLASGLILDSLHYWKDAMGVDGFRFDLAPVLGNTCGPGCFTFDPTSLPRTIAQQFARPAGGGDGADLIAEPWGVGAGTYQVGHFPAGWSEWNDHVRDTVRQDQNDAGTIAITPGALATRIAGSPDLYDHDGRAPSAGITYLVSHDGFTLHDLYACAAPNNTQAWPYGPSSGGSTTNYSWDHGGDPVAQRQAVRTGLALELLAAGTPMITGGDELARTIQCNNNPYNLDSTATWLDWSSQGDALWTFAQRLFQFRAAHPELRPATWLTPPLYDANGQPASAAYLGDATQPIVMWTAGTTTLVAYNRGAAKLTITLPPAPAGLSWWRAANTAAFLEPQDNFVPPGQEQQVTTPTYDLDARALVLLIAR